MSVQSKIFLNQSLSRLLPEVFQHPVWIQFAGSLPARSPALLSSILHDLQQEEVEDAVTQCQVLFICAYLQSRLGTHVEAAVSLDQALKLAETHELAHLSLCAMWGMCVMHARLGEVRQSTDWLARLQEKVKENREWVLFSILDLLKQNIRAQTNPGGEELMDWLLCWGEMPLSEQPDAHTDQKKSFVGSIAGSVFHRFRGWNLFRNHAKSNAGSDLFLRATPRNQSSPAHTENKPLIAAQDNSAPRDLSGRELFLKENGKPSLALAPPRESIHAESPASATRPVVTEQNGLTLAVYCLGQFQVYQGEQPVENWSSRKGLSVFKYLILEHPAPVVKEILMDKFWPDSDPEAARRNLHQAIYSLRQTFRGENQGFHHIWFKNDCYSLNPNVEIWIDFQEFVKCAEDGRRLEKSGRFEEAIEQYGIAEGLYQGDFLEEDLYDEWTVPQREQFLNLYLGVVDRLCELYLEKRQYTTVSQFCHRLLAKDGSYESAHRMLMQCYLAQGQRNLAVRQYQTCVRALRQDLGIPPSEETVALYRRIASRQSP